MHNQQHNVEFSIFRGTTFRTTCAAATRPSPDATGSSTRNEWRIMCGGREEPCALLWARVARRALLLRFLYYSHTMMTVVVVVVDAARAPNDIGEDRAVVISLVVVAVVVVVVVHDDDPSLSSPPHPPRLGPSAAVAAHRRG